MMFGQQRSQRAPDRDGASGRPSQNDPAIIVAVDELHDREAAAPAVRRIQARLSRSVAAGARKPWSPRATLLFILAVCGGFWLALGALIMWVIR